MISKNKAGKIHISIDKKIKRGLGELSFSVYTGMTSKLAAAAQNKNKQSHYHRKMKKETEWGLFLAEQSSS